MLIEEHRPRTLYEIVGQDDNIEVIKGFLKKGELPHILLYGPAGVGKTSTATAIGHEYFGEDYHDYFIELNASDERGIAVVQEKIKKTAQAHIEDYDYKIIFLDEVDSMTKDAQNALRRIMERNSKNTRFILSCNNKEKLIEALVNRCVPFSYARLKPEAVEKYINLVTKKNNIEFESDEVKKRLIEISNGSVRTVLSTLEKFIATDKDLITHRLLDKYTKTITEEDIKKLIKDIEGQRYHLVDSYVDIYIIDKAYNPQEIIEKIRDYIKSTDNFSTKTKLKLLRIAGEIDFRISQGATATIQLKTFFAIMMLELTK